MRRTVAATLAALVALVITGCGDATETASTGDPAATGHPSDWLVEVTDSAELSEPVVAQGRIVDGEGNGVADADVGLTVWPGHIAEAARAELPDDPSGYIDFEIHAIAPAGMMSYSWTAVAADPSTPGVFVRADADPADPAAAEAVTVDINIVDMTYDDGTDAATMDEELPSP